MTGELKQVRIGNSTNSFRIEESGVLALIEKIKTAKHEQDELAALRMRTAKEKRKKHIAVPVPGDVQWESPEEITKRARRYRGRELATVDSLTEAIQRRQERKSF
jgi:hypothetical protein